MQQMYSVSGTCKIKCAIAHFAHIIAQNKLKIYIGFYIIFYTSSLNFCFRTSYEYGMSTLSPVLQPQVPQVPQLPLFPQQPQFTVTTAPLITQTLATVSESRVLKLTFGAKTAYTTLFSTKVVPTELTTYVTNTVPVQPTVAAYPGYYPAPVPYPPFPFVG